MNTTIKKVIRITFPEDSELIAQLRNALPAAKWSTTAKKWYLPDVLRIRTAL